jgi:hypothetical protein
VDSFEQQAQLAHFSGLVWALVKYFGDGDEVVLQNVADLYEVPNFIEVDTQVVGKDFKIRAKGLDDLIK